MSDDALWSAARLRPLLTHVNPNVRAWALEKMSRGVQEDDLDRFVDAVSDSATRDVAIDTLARWPGGLGTRAVEALRAVIDDEEVGTVVAALLASRGDAGAILALERACLDPESRTDEWESFARHAPEHARALASSRGWFEAPTAAPKAALSALVTLCPVERLGGVLQVAWEGAAGAIRALLARAESDHVPWIDRSDDARLNAYVAQVVEGLAGPRSDRDRALAARWESIDELRPLVASLFNHRWGDALRWCEARVGLLRRGGDEPCAVARAAMAWLTRQRRPDEEMALVGVMLALAGTDRAVEAELHFEQADLATKLVRACVCPEARGKARGMGAIDAWEAAPAGGLERAHAVDALRRVFAHGNDDAVRGAWRLLNGIRLEEVPEEGLARNLAKDEGTFASRVRALARRPEALLSLAPRVLATPGHPCANDVIDALGALDSRRATDVLLTYGLRLEVPFALVLACDSLVRLGDVDAFPRLTATLSPAFLPEADALVRSAEIAHALRPDDALEAALTSPPGARDAPMRVAVACDACGEVGEHEVASARVVHPRHAAFAMDWDGVTFDRVLTCARCGAEDRYTLRPAAVVTLARHYLASADDAAPRVEMGRRYDATGTVALRRMSDGPIHWRARVEARPDDAHAWEALGHAQAALGRHAEAEEALAMAWSLGCVGVSHLLALRASRVALGRGEAACDEAVRAMVTQLGASRGASRAEAAALVTDLCARVAGRGEPASLTLTWSVEGAPTQVQVDLARMTRWERLREMLSAEHVTAAALREGEAAPDGDFTASLEAARSAYEVFARKATLAETARELRAERALEARFKAAGRNDPCPCGSGKKYKKCHLA